MYHWLVEIPARIIDIWFMLYGFVILAATIISVTAVLATLLLAAFGIRWGW